MVSPSSARFPSEQRPSEPRSASRWARQARLGVRSGGRRSSAIGRVGSTACRGSAAVGLPGSAGGSTAAGSAGLDGLRRGVERAPGLGGRIDLLAVLARRHHLVGRIRGDRRGLELGRAARAVARPRRGFRSRSRHGHFRSRAAVPVLARDELALGHLRLAGGHARRRSRGRSGCTSGSRRRCRG